MGPLLTVSFNVAITRAKELLVVVGNANLLKVRRASRSVHLC
jgi:superfamily I DNA and/or RNA helicase